MRPPNLHCSPGTPLPLRPLRAGGAISRAWHHTQQWGSLSVSACTRGGQAARPSANVVATSVALATWQSSWRFCVAADPIGLSCLLLLLLSPNEAAPLGGR